MERDQSGELGIVKAFAPGKPATRDKAEQPAAGTPANAAPLPIVDIDSLLVNDGKVMFTDWQPAAAAEGSEEHAREPARLLVDRITFKGGSLSTQKEKKGTVELSLNVNRKGTVTASGTIALNPLDLEVAVNVSDLALAPFQPYVAQKAEVLVADGGFFTKGAARVKQGAAQGLSVTYRGSASVNRLAVRDSRNNDELLTWKALRIDGIDAATSPLSVKIGTIALTDWFANIVVEEDGVLTLQKIAKKGPVAEAQPAAPVGEVPTPAPAEQAGSPDIAIGKVTLTNGSVTFIDKNVKPRYAANLVEINGNVSGLSSKADRMADVMLRGSLDQYAPLVIEGKINPFPKELFVDMKAGFKDMELSTLTPYSGTYIGKAVEKGKLSFDLQYHIANKKLDAKNDVFIDQLTLGEKIDSPKATSLPVGLAISLLKNRKGEIKLDIPVAGEIDNPEFSVWRIVLQVLVNLLTKAATSPFALLGSMMGGEELGYVEFDYGVSAMTEQNAKKIDALVNALYERPELKLEIAGHVDPTGDREALRTARMKNLIAARKIKDMPQQGDQPIPPESVQVSVA
ncbi:MAG TPA: DUF748 domain-containing protein, partial [Nitrospirota bacterium]